MVIPPKAIDLSGPDDGQKADDGGPDFIEDEAADQGQDAQADQPI